MMDIINIKEQITPVLTHYGVQCAALFNPTIRGKRYINPYGWTLGISETIIWGKIEKPGFGVIIFSG